ncbi:MAG TPA: NfeD family protein [Actinopolymorphaceae bacterium]|jgi:membrane protein implicated in regulation of membrane protease activity
MFEWLADNTALAWLIAALALVGADMLIGLDFWLLMFGMGALAGAGVVALGAGTPVALIVAAVVSLVMLFLVRPPVLKRLHAGPDLRLEPMRELLGRHTRATGPISDNAGQVIFDGVVWTARPYIETTTIPAGTPVEVFDVDGVTVLVHPLDDELFDPDRSGRRT